MTFTYQIDEPDFVSAGKLLLRTRKSFMVRRIIVYICLLIMLASCATFLYLRQFTGAALTALFVLFYACFPVLTGWQFRRQFRKIPALHEPRTLDADAAGVRIVSPLSDSRFNWQVLDRFGENDRTFILVQQGGRVFFPISKRQLTPEQTLEFRTLCTNHIARR
jgi:hypothetical protein